MIEYVCGFMFSSDNKLLLIQKSHPEWQKGKLNGVGGKIESGEVPSRAMYREFFEETGLETKESDWKNFVILRGLDWCVYFFKVGPVFGTASLLNERMKPKTEEPLQWVDPSELHSHNVIPNLLWLVPLALDRDLVFPIGINDWSIPAVNGMAVSGEKK